MLKSCVRKYEYSLVLAHCYTSLCPPPLCASFFCNTLWTAQWLVSTPINQFSCLRFSQINWYHSMNTPQIHCSLVPFVWILRFILICWKPPLFRWLSFVLLGVGSKVHKSILGSSLKNWSKVHLTKTWKTKHLKTLGNRLMKILLLSVFIILFFIL